MGGGWRVVAQVAGLGLVVGLTGCSLMPERVPMSATRAEIASRIGQPTAVYPLADGTRLQYSRQPAGQRVYNLDLDASGRLLKVEQVMDAGWLQRIEVNRWTRDDALLHLGRPALIERVASWDGDIWTYRFLEVTVSRQLHLHLDSAGVVRRLMFTDEPLPEDRADFAR